MTATLRMMLFGFIFVLGLACAVKVKIGIALAIVSILPLFFLHFLEAGLLFVLFCIPFDRLLILGEGGLTITKVFILFTISAWLVHVLVTRDARVLEAIYKRRTSILAIGYLLMSFVSLVNARDLDEATILLMRRTNVIVLYFLVLSMVKNRAALNRAINVVLFASLFVALIGMYELTSGNQVLTEAQRGEELAITQEGSQRIQGCAGNSNFHAAVLAMLLPLALVRSMQARGLIQVAFTYGLVGLYILNIYATNTRLGMLGMMLGFVGVFLLSDIRLKFLKLFGVGIVLICMLLVMSLDRSRFSTDRYTGDSGQKTIEYRVGWMLMSFEMAKNHPFLGVGVGNYYSEYNEYRRVAPHLVPRGRIRNHNGVMQVWAEMGTIGLLVFLGLLFCAPLEIYASTRHQRGDPELVHLRNGLLVGFAVWVLMIGIIPVLEHEVAWLCLGLAMALGDLAPAAETVKVEHAPRRVGALSIATG